MLPNSINDLIESFKLLPGVGAKTAERLAFAVIDMEKENVDFFSNSLTQVKQKIKHCKICNSLTDDDICSICNDDTRKKDILCVLDDSKNVFLFEKLNIFRGKYHVLDGLISPLDGINPEDIGIDKLLDRIKKEDYKEILFAFKPSIEGETTSLYIKKILDGNDIKITRLASGVPMGADMEYIDELTLERALEDRKEIE